MGLLICMSDKLSVLSCWLGSTETVLGTSIQREGRGGGRCCTLVWGKKLKRGVDCSIQYCSLSFLIFTDDTAEVWGRVAICPKPAIHLRKKMSLEHWCVSRSLMFDAWCSRPGPLASLSSG